jgi:hypothetical protein
VSRRRRHQPPPVCPYCEEAAALIDSVAIYRTRSYGLVWACLPCDAWVGVHKGGTLPKGRLADKALRDMKIRAHGAFDPLWQGGAMARSEAYAWLADHLGVDRRDCHIGMFDVDQCQRVVMVCDWWRERGAAVA